MATAYTNCTVMLIGNYLKGWLKIYCKGVDMKVVKQKIFNKSGKFSGTITLLKYFKYKFCIPL